MGGRNSCDGDLLVIGVAVVRKKSKPVRARAASAKATIPAKRAIAALRGEGETFWFLFVQ